MNVNDFLLQVNSNLNNVICVDFDGVIHNNNLGFHDGTCYGLPIEGTLKSLKSLSKKYKIIIFTCKANPNRPLIDGKTGIELVWEWLEKYDIKKYIEDVTFTKPNAMAYIDDKAIKFESWEQIQSELKLEEIKWVK